MAYFEIVTVKVVSETLVVAANTEEEALESYRTKLRTITNMSIDGETLRDYEIVSVRDVNGL